MKNLLAMTALATGILAALPGLAQDKTLVSFIHKFPEPQNMAYFDKLEQRCQTALQRGPCALDGDIEAIVGFRFAEALPPDADAAALEGFYRPGHHRAIRAMLQHLLAVANTG